MNEWRRLDPRMIVVAPVHALIRLVPLLLIVLVTGGSGDPVRLWITFGIAGLVVLGGLVRWRTTKYRITPERVELHSGWVRRQRRSVPRDRIRTVDLTAPLLHRAFRLNVVAVRAAESGGEHSGLNLDAVSTAEGESLRRELLERPSVPDPEAPAGPGAEPLARLDWSWLRFAPLTFSSLAGIGAIAAAGFNLLTELNVDPRRVGGVAARLTAAPLWVAIAVVGAGFLVLAVVGSVVLFVERWWGYRLTREADGTLRVRRGLLTTRSLSVAEDRLRGVSVHEPLLLRAGRGAQTRALAAGLGREAQGGVLQPPVPRAEAHRVAGAALTAADPTLTPLSPHPRSALRRRVTRAVVPAALVVAAAVVVGRVWPRLEWIAPTAAVLLPLAALLAWDRYRGLGHALTESHLVSRLGGLSRRTVAVQRSGIVGWRVRQSVFQRRAGLVTCEAVTAAGEGGYRILDMDAAEVAALIARTPLTDAVASRRCSG
ncbi:PH domain-containing protein [Pseudonocardia xishanensis]|uniref:PH domain-containing protein n=1 Tax=Pseudonocardia xishanensis TaxID=630995 RepID=A0ABP8S1G9_9PSEU